VRAVEAQATLAEANSGLAPDRRISFRIGIHIGDVMVRAGDLFRDGVNIAARLRMFVPQSPMHPMGHKLVKTLPKT
jgi:class 3 adenylate cyclase